MTLGHWSTAGTSHGLHEAVGDLVHTISTTIRCDQPSNKPAVTARATATPTEGDSVELLLQAQART